MTLLALPNELLLKIFEYLLGQPPNEARTTTSSKEETMHSLFFHALAHTNHRLREIFKDYLLHSTTWTVAGSHHIDFLKLCRITGRPERLCIQASVGNHRSMFSASLALLELRSGPRLRSLTIEFDLSPCRRRQCLFRPNDHIWDPEDTIWDRNLREALIAGMSAIRGVGNWPYSMSVRVVVRHMSCCTKQKTWKKFRKQMDRTFKTVTMSPGHLFLENPL